MKKIFDWFLYSSVNPTQVATTVKGVVIGVIPFLMTLLPALGINVAPGLETLPNLIYGVVFYTLTAVSLIVSAFGFARKIYALLRQLYGLFFGFEMK